MYLQEVMNDEFNPIAMHAGTVAFMRYSVPKFESFQILSAKNY